MRPRFLIQRSKVIPRPHTLPLFTRYYEPLENQKARYFCNSRTIRMATASKVKLDPSWRPVFAVEELKQEAADTVSELLQENHEKHHIFFNQDGFHVCVTLASTFLSLA